MLLTKTIPIGCDFIRMGFTFNGAVKFDPAIWDFVRKKKENGSDYINRKKRRVRESFSRDYRWIRLFCRQINPNCHYFYLEFSPNHVRWGKNTIPAMPDDTEYILDYLQEFLDRFFPFHEIAPIRSDRWIVTGVDYNLDMKVPPVIAASLVNSFSNLPFKRGSFEESYFYNRRTKYEEEIAGEMVEVDELEYDDRGNFDPATGVSVRNAGDRFTYGQTIYNKYEQVSEEVLKAERKIENEHYQRTGDWNPWRCDTMQEFLSEWQKSPLYGISPDLHRFEVKFRGSNALKRIGLQNRTIEGVLRYANRIRAFQNILDRHGIETIPDDPIQPLKEFHYSLGSNSRKKLFGDGYEPTDFLRYILRCDFDTANENGIRPKPTPYSEPQLRKIRNACFKLGLYNADVNDNFFLLHHAEHILKASAGCTVAMPDWWEFAEPSPEPESKQARVIEPTTSMILTQPDKRKESEDEPNDVWPAVNRAERLRKSRNKPFRYLYGESSSRIARHPHSAGVETQGYIKRVFPTRTALSSGFFSLTLDRIRLTSTMFRG